MKNISNAFPGFAPATVEKTHDRKTVSSDVRVSG